MQQSNLTALAALKKMRQNQSSTKASVVRQINQVPDHFLIIKPDNEEKP